MQRELRQDSTSTDLVYIIRTLAFSTNVSRENYRGVSGHSPTLDRVPLVHFVLLTFGWSSEARLIGALG